MGSQYMPQQDFSDTDILSVIIIGVIRVYSLCGRFCVGILCIVWVNFHSLKLCGA